MVQQTKFNMSAATLERLDEWLRRSMAHFSCGNLPKYFEALKNIKMNAQFKFKTTERKRLRGFESAYIESRDIKMRWAIAEKYNEILLDYMDKYGLLLPDKVEDLETSY